MYLTDFYIAEILDPRDPGDAALNLAEILYLTGDPARAEEMTQRAIDWYQRGLISQGRGAEIAGVPRADFIDALAAISDTQSPAA